MAQVRLALVDLGCLVQEVRLLLLLRLHPIQVQDSADRLDSVLAVDSEGDFVADSTEVCSIADSVEGFEAD